MAGGGCPFASQLIVREPFNKTAPSDGSICQNGGTTKNMNGLMFCKNSLLLLCS